MTSNADVYLCALKRFLAEGMTPLEAVRQFDDEKLSQAFRDSLEEVDEDSRAFIDIMGKAGREERNEKDLEQAMELWLAGWTSESPTNREDVMSWYWRAPPKGSRPLGRRYLSTNQAYNALKKVK